MVAIHLSASGRGKYSNVLHELWDDAPIRELSADAKLLFLWSFTNSACASLTGLTPVSPRKLRRVLHEAPLAAEKRIESALDELARKPLVVYDWDQELLWCVERTKHVNSSPKVAIGVANWFASISASHPSPLLAKWKRRYGALLDEVGA